MLKKEPRYFPVSFFNRVMFDAAYTMLKYKKELKLIDKEFRSKIMLAATEVNGCRICEYYHSKILLENGTDEKELQAILEGEIGKIDEKEAVALMFSEHYADKSGKYDIEAFKKVKDYYGNDKAQGIMATIKLIMFGNISGISWINLKTWLSFKRPSNAKFFTDFYNSFIFLFIFPFLFIAALFKKKVIY